jgi:O-acetyl-ADP-ribose deacetylase (regulator of RNase III)
MTPSQGGIRAPLLHALGFGATFPQCPTTIPYHYRSELAMIEFRIGDIFQTDAEALVNPVNCIGTMGRGLALQFKNAFPDNFKAYELACAREDVQPGRMFVFETGYLTNPKYIINFPTKRHWRGNSRIEDIESGLKALADEIRHRSIRSVAIPALGCGLGGLEWGQVRPRTEASFAPLQRVRIIVFEPDCSSVQAPVESDSTLPHKLIA